MCDTKKAKIQRCDIEKVLFVACDILPAHTSRVWYLKGDHQNSAISVIPACYTNTSAYIKSGHFIKGVTLKQASVGE